MQTNPAVEQNKNIKWSESLWNQSDEFGIKRWMTPRAKPTLSAGFLQLTTTERGHSVKSSVTRTCRRRSVVCSVRAAGWERAQQSQCPRNATQDHYVHGQRPAHERHAISCRRPPAHASLWSQYDAGCLGEAGTCLYPARRDRDPRPLEHTFIAHKTHRDSCDECLRQTAHNKPTTTTCFTRRYKRSVHCSTRLNCTILFPYLLFYSVHRRSQDFLWEWVHFSSSKKLTTFLVVALKTQTKYTKWITPTVHISPIV